RLWTGRRRADPWPMAVQLEVDRHVLRLEVLLDSFRAALAPESRVLDPSERCSRVGHQAAVEPHHAGLEALDHLESALHVAGEDVGDKSELRRICRGDRLVVALERGHRSDRTEHLLAEDARVRADTF